MPIWMFVVFGLVQGLTEFLPVSSSGHLVLLRLVFGFDGNFLLFAVLLHLATLLAVVVVLRNQVWELVKHPFGTKAQKLVVATLLTVGLVLVGEEWVESFFDGAFLPLAFALTGFLLVLTSLVERNSTKKEIGWKSALVMGLAQGIAVNPGVSRSGSTICAGLLSGENKSESARFSFLMSLPIIVASLVYECLHYDTSVVMSSALVWGSMLSFVVAFVSGMFAITWMLHIVQKGKLWMFGVYLFALSAISLLLL